MITVAGFGVLANAIARIAPGDAAPAVTVPATDSRCLPAEDGQGTMPTLPVRTELGRVVIGPAESPGVPGCRECVRIRTARADADARKTDAVLGKNGSAITERGSAWLTAAAADLVAALVVAEARELATGGGRTEGAVLVVTLADLRVRRHRFLSDPLCPVCGELPDDSPEAATFTLEPRKKLAPEVPRVRDVAAELPALVDTYVDERTGLIRTTKSGTLGGLTVASAMLPIRAGTGLEPGVGRTRSYRASKLTAVLEAIERYGGVSPGGKRTVVSASYAEIADHAVSPAALGLHPPECYALPGFEYQPFAVDTPCRWVWGYSFATQRPVLVPENHVYYYMRHMPGGEKPFAFEISNGCALGGCLEEAIMHGLLEVVERDAFLMTWYARLAARRIDLTGGIDREVALQAAAITADSGHRVLCFDTTMEHGIPSVWAMALDESGDPSRPRTAHAAASHLTLERAAMNALSELGPLLADLVQRYPDEADRAAAMVADPALVSHMHDHSTLYAAPQATERLSFLLEGGGRRDLAADPTPFDGVDLTEDLRDMTDRLIAAGMDVVVVDQTTPEHQAGGFRCVKVVVPGSLPMTFGHQHRRTEGLPRLARVGRLLGFRDRDLDPSELNTHPHPFP